MSLPKRNLAARAGHWSARHRKIAIGGWLAFVVIAFVLGGAIGTNTLDGRGLRQRVVARRRQGDHRRGLPRQGRRAGARSGPRRQADRRPTRSSRPASTPSSPSSRRRRSTSSRSSRRSPRATRARSPRTAARRSSRSAFPATSELTDKRVDATLDATAAAQKQHPELRIEQFGDASADKALGASPRRRLQARGVPQPADHDDDPDRRLRRARRGGRAAAAGDHRRDRHARPGRPDQPDRPDGGVRELA